MDGKVEVGGAVGVGPEGPPAGGEPNPAEVPVGAGVVGDQVTPGISVT